MRKKWTAWIVTGSFLLYAAAVSVGSIGDLLKPLTHGLGG